MSYENLDVSNTMFRPYLMSCAPNIRVIPALLTYSRVPNKPRLPNKNSHWKFSTKSTNVVLRIRLKGQKRYPNKGIVL